MNAFSVSFCLARGLRHSLAKLLVLTLTSLAGTFALQAAPIVVQQQGALIVGVGDAVVLRAVTSGTGTLTHQWRKNGVPIPGAISNDFAITPKLTDAGDYDLRVTDVTGASVSGKVVLRVVSRDLVQKGAALAGKSITLNVNSSGAGLTYAWYKESERLGDGTRYQGTNTAALKINNLGTTDMGIYRCMVNFGQLSLVTNPLQVEILATPVLTAIESPVTVTVSGTVARQVEFTGGTPSRYVATGLPPGLVINPTTGFISGKPSRAGAFVSKITASNAAGTSAPLTVNWLVEALPAGTVGTFYALLDRHPYYNGGYGGSVIVTVTSTGAFSGSITRGVHRNSFSGQLNAQPGGFAPQGGFLVPRRSPFVPLVAQFSLAPANGQGTGGRISGSLQEPGSDVISFDGFHAAYGASTPATAFVGSWNTALELPSPLIGNATYPQGAGWTIQTVARTGVVTTTGRLADGTAFTSSSGLSLEGLSALHLMLYNYTGSVQGVQALNSASSTSGAALDWVKSDQGSASTTRSYKAGFPLHELIGSGGRYARPVGAALIFGIAPGANNARVTFREGGLFQPYTQILTLAAGNVLQLPTAPGSNPYQIRLSLNVATGVVTGTGTAMDFDSNNPNGTRQRPGTMSALLIPTLEQALGHFLLPTDRGTTSPILSGKVVGEENGILTLQ